MGGRQQPGRRGPQPQGNEVLAWAGIPSHGLFFPSGYSWGCAIPAGACPGSVIKESGGNEARQPWQPLPGQLVPVGGLRPLTPSRGCCAMERTLLGRMQDPPISLGPQVPDATSQPHQRGHLSGQAGHALPGEPQAASAPPDPPPRADFSCRCLPLPPQDTVRMQEEIQGTLRASYSSPTSLSPPTRR